MGCFPAGILEGAFLPFGRLAPDRQNCFLIFFYPLSFIFYLFILYLFILYLLSFVLYSFTRFHRFHFSWLLSTGRFPVPRETLEERRRLMSWDAFLSEFNVRYVLHRSESAFSGVRGTGQAGLTNPCEPTKLCQLNYFKNTIELYRKNEYNKSR